MTVSVQIANPEVFAFIAVLVFWVETICLWTEKAIETVK